MNITYRVYFENNKGENFWHDLPTQEEAVERVMELTDDGFIVNPSIEKLRT